MNTMMMGVEKSRLREGKEKKSLDSVREKERKKEKCI